MTFTNASLVWWFNSVEAMYRMYHVTTLFGLRHLCGGLIRCLNMVVVNICNIDWIVYHVFVINVVFKVNYGRYIDGATLLSFVNNCNGIVGIRGRNRLSGICGIYGICRVDRSCTISITRTLLGAVFVAIISNTLLSAGFKAIILIPITTTR